MQSLHQTELIIFDLDGTLADSLDDIAASMNQTLAELGLPTRSPRAVAAMVGWGVEGLVERALGPERAALRDRALAIYRAHYAQNAVARTRPYPGIPALLDALVAAELPMAVLSNKPARLTERVVAQLLARWPFVAVIGHRPQVPRKPDPTAALAICRQARVAPSRAVLVGDTAVDLDTAARAGMSAVAASWGFRSRQELIAHGAARVIDRPDQLLDAIGRGRITGLGSDVEA